MHIKKSIIRTLAFVTVCLPLIMASCEDELIGREEANTPVNNFEYFWKTFDTRYGLFDVKAINWDSVYRKFRPRVSNDMSDEELYRVFCDMIVLLNDNHVNLYPTNGALPAFPGGVLRYRNGVLTIKRAQEDYDIAVVKKYVTDYRQVTGNLGYGTLPASIGYISFRGTDKLKETKQAMTDMLRELRDTKAMIIDIRGNTGGSDVVSQYIAGSFTSEKKPYMITRKRNGPNHTDFEKPQVWYVEPSGSLQYTKPIVVLTSAFSQSTAETFALAMNELDHVTLVGDTTAGSYSDNPTTEMYNGWMLSLSVGDFRAMNGKSYEGIGTPPDIWVCNSKEDLLAGNDRMLKQAMEFLNK